jgi:hypothetical protein
MFPKAFVSACKATQCHNPNDHKLYENMYLNSCIFNIFIYSLYANFHGLDKVLEVIVSAGEKEKAHDGSSRLKTVVNCFAGIICSAYSVPFCTNSLWSFKSNNDRQNSC